MKTLKNIILVALVVVGSALVVGCGAAPEHDPSGNTEEALPVGSPRCNPETQCCARGWGYAPGADGCYAALLSLGCRGEGPFIGMGSNQHAYFDVGCPAGTAGPAACVPDGVLQYDNLCGSGLAVDPNCGGGCHLQ